LETSYNVTEGSPSEQFATYIQVKPEKLFFGRRPPVPLCNTEIDMIVGEPIEFDLVGLKQEAGSINDTPWFILWKEGMSNHHTGCARLGCSNMALPEDVWYDSICDGESAEISSELETAVA
jgi:hypothetical protein